MFQEWQWILFFPTSTIHGFFVTAFGFNVLSTDLQSALIPISPKKKPHSSFKSGKGKGKARFFPVYKFSGKSLLNLLAEMCLPWFMFYCTVVFTLEMN